MNPEHLFEGSQADNVADMVAKGRQQTGASYKLTEDQLRAVRVLVREGFRQHLVGKWFGVSHTTVWKIVRARS